jgi:hypothetical protein
LFVTDVTWTVLGTNPGLCGERLVTNHLSEPWHSHKLEINMHSLIEVKCKVRKRGNWLRIPSSLNVIVFQPSYSTEELNQEMANLEGLMKDLNAITASEFEC